MKELVEHALGRAYDKFGDTSALYLGTNQVWLGVVKMGAKQFYKWHDKALVVKLQAMVELELARTTAAATAEQAKIALLPVERRPVLNTIWRELQERTGVLTEISCRLEQQSGIEFDEDATRFFTAAFSSDSDEPEGELILL